MAVVIPETYTDVFLSVVVPSPSWPNPFWPQQRTLPLDRVAQVWASPAEMDVAVVIPETYTGVSLWVVVPSPSRPYSFFPQHMTCPLSKTAHVCDSPAETFLTETLFNFAHNSNVISSVISKLAEVGTSTKSSTPSKLLAPPNFPPDV